MQSTDYVRREFSGMTMITQVQTALTSLVGKRWFAYGVIFFLQLKMMWNAWLYLDLVEGDTSSYFSQAWQWYEHFQNVFIWSPLYTAYYGTLMHLFPDAHIVTIVHRLIIVFVVSLLVLLLMRRLLSPGIALLVTVWWVVLPINFQTLYEVHLFAAIPTLIVCIIAAQKPSIWSRGGVLGVLMLATILVRNELTIATGLWGFVCLIIEWRQIRLRQNPAWWQYVIGYGLPVLLAGVVSLFFFNRSYVQGVDLERGFESKHTLNVCQIYAFNYQQQFDDFQGSPWTECHLLMERDFGEPYPSMTRAIQLNPSAMLNYFGWNIRLIPMGLQVLLFNGTSGNLNPDYVDVALRYQPATQLSILIIVIIVSGVALLWRNREFFWTHWLRERYLGWIALMCVSATVGVVMLMQRPRPSYMFNLSFLLMALTGLSAYAIVYRWQAAKHLQALLPIVIIGMLVLWPSYYGSDGSKPITPVADRYHRLRPFSSLLENGTVLYGGNNAEVHRYLTGIQAMQPSFRAYQIEPSTQLSFTEWLDNGNIQVIYVEETMLQDAAVQTWLQAIRAGTEWRIVVDYRHDAESWLLLERIDSG
jgi:hypothetical protein